MDIRERNRDLREGMGLLRYYEPELVFIISQLEKLPPLPKREIPPEPVAEKNVGLLGPVASPVVRFKENEVYEQEITAWRKQRKETVHSLYPDYNLLKTKVIDATLNFDTKYFEDDHHHYYPRDNEFIKHMDGPLLKYFEKRREVLHKLFKCQLELMYSFYTALFWQFDDTDPDDFPPTQQSLPDEKELKQLSPKDRETWDNLYGADAVFRAISRKTVRFIQTINEHMTDFYAEPEDFDETIFEPLPPIFWKGTQKDLVWILDQIKSRGLIEYKTDIVLFQHFDWKNKKDDPRKVAVSCQEARSQMNPKTENYNKRPSEKIQKVGKLLDNITPITNDPE